MKTDQHSNAGIAAVLVAATALIAAPSRLAAGSPQTVGAAIAEHSIEVSVAGDLFTVYRTEQFGRGHKYPFLYPVNGPASGKSVTTYDREPYPHHSSLFMSLDHVASEGIGRANYWQPRDALATGRVRSGGPRIMAADGAKVVIRDEAVWSVEGHDPQLRDTRTVTIFAPSETLRVLDFRFEFEVLRDLTVGPTGHAMFSARMHPDLAGAAGGTILDAAGREGEQATRGQTADWVAAFHQRDGIVEGLAIVQHPENPYYPAPWFTRDYGFLSPNPVWKTSRRWNEGDEFTQRFRVLVFAGPPAEAGVAQWAGEFPGESAE
jgi:hypothetical protein